MTKKSQFHINVSITDMPVFCSLEYLFSGMKNAGVDGLEIVIGVKSRLALPHLQKLSEKYNLPIISFHQPPWSGLGWYLDEGFIREGKAIGVSQYTFHPLPRFSFADEQMKSYFSWISRMQEKYQISAHLENMQKVIRPGFLSQLIPLHEQTTDYDAIIRIVKEYGLSMTFDTSHAYVISPQKQTWFAAIYPYIGNIHLSSFNDTTDHLPLHVGKFDNRGFLSELQKRQYKGLLTFEIFYPKLPLWGYNFAAIKKSVEIVKNISV